VKIIVMSAVAALLLAYAASFVLNQEHRPAYESFVGSGARVGDPGHNLVGENWSGQPPIPRS
jgi:hypothetical protein